MYILVGAITFAVLYVFYVGLVHIKSSMLPMERMLSKDVDVENVKMQQFFHFKIKE